MNFAPHNAAGEPHFRFGSALTNAQKDYFDTHGFLHFRQFIDRATVRGLLAEVASVEDHLLRTGCDKVNGIPLKFGFDGERNRPFLQRIAFTSQYSETLSRFLKDPRFNLLAALLQPFEARIGEHEKDGLVFNHYVNQTDSAFLRLGWHTDAPRDLFLGTRIKPMLNVGLHLDDCPAANGGLRILPGTHKQGAFRLLFRKKYFIDHRPDPKEVGFNVKAGDLTVHDGRTWHRVEQSPLTGTASRRRVMYIPVVTGEYAPKHEGSPTPFYHIVGRAIARKKYPLRAALAS